VISPTGDGDLGTAQSTKVFDPAARLSPSPAPLGERFDRRFKLTITQKVGFLDGKPGRHWALNGKLYPRVPMFEVSKGDLVAHCAQILPKYMIPQEFDLRDFLPKTSTGKIDRQGLLKELNAGKV